MQGEHWLACHARARGLIAPCCMACCAQIDKDEVRLRRTIGAKKDDYTLDRKHVT